MYSVDNFFEKIKKAVGNDGRIAFATSVIAGLLAHIPAMVIDAPNHDGLSSMYFDQNMITSGRWFLGIACGISSYYSLPWLISVLSIVYLALTSILLIKMLRVTTPVFIVLISGLLVTFPVLVSNFAYLFTMDGYMLGLLLAVLAAYAVEKTKLGFVIGGVLLSLSMGIYQAYLPITVLLSFYAVLVIFAADKSIKEKIVKALNYLYMGGIGVALYYIILKVLLSVQGKELASYQGINETTSSGLSLPSTIRDIYVDFVAFSTKSKILFSNKFALAAVLVFGVIFITVFIETAISKKWIKSFWFYVIALLTVLLLPVCFNIILFISSDVTYHLLMRYQWIFLIIIPLAFTENMLKEDDGKFVNAGCFLCIASVLVIIFSFVVTDNIAYSNLQKKYEKTYAYCVRLADRIEQTEGYYQGMPVYMLGILGEENFPITDITADVTDHMVGIGGDYLVYNGDNIEQFMKYYLGITMNIVDTSDYANIYFEQWYDDMPAFPDKGSIKIVDGVLCVKTENKRK